MRIRRYTFQAVTYFSYFEIDAVHYDFEPRCHKWSFWPGQPLCPIAPEIWIRRREAKVNWM
jgi:hypothetical protein